VTFFAGAGRWLLTTENRQKFKTLSISDNIDTIIKLISHVQEWGKRVREDFSATGNTVFQTTANKCRGRCAE
jgi:hypothetical protein